MSGTLTREQVVAVYRQVLERIPAEHEVAHHLAATPTLDAMLRVALDSEEYRFHNPAARPAPGPPYFLNHFHPGLERWGRPVGLLSDDQVAIVGHEGWLFLAGGSNANLGQYVGQVAMEPDWLEGWRTVLREREAAVASLGVAAVTLVVPDKLAIYEDRFPLPLERVAPRPIERLQAEQLDLVYPLASLQAAVERGEEAFLRTDTHLTFRGNELLYESVRERLGITAALDVAQLPHEVYVAPGDLGQKYEPAVVEVISAPNTWSGARVVADNRDEVAAGGGHIGTRRVFANECAPDPRTVVVFGDSYGFSAPHYQGLSWFLAQVFRETHFVWTPFGWDPGYVRATGAEAVVVQGAERFIARVPDVAVSVDELVAAALPQAAPAGDSD